MTTAANQPAPQEPDDAGYWVARMNDAGRAALTAWLAQKAAPPAPQLAGWVQSAEYTMECALTSEHSPSVLEMDPSEAASGQAEALPLERAWFAITRQE